MTHEQLAGLKARTSVHGHVDGGTALELIDALEAAQANTRELDLYLGREADAKIGLAASLVDERRRSWALAESLETAQSERNKLLRFIRHLWRERLLWDYEGMQEIATEHGILVETTATEPCCEDCSCAEWDYFPQTCYRVAQWIQDAMEDNNHG